MKILVLVTLKLYQNLLSPVLSALFPSEGCRFSPVCSAYTYEAIQEKGVIRGLFLGFKRVLKCNPWN